jgi:small-conductance mechanosensitive channel
MMELTSGSSPDTGNLYEIYNDPQSVEEQQYSQNVGTVEPPQLQQKEQQKQEYQTVIEKHDAKKLTKQLENEVHLNMQQQQHLEQQQQQQQQTQLQQQQQQQHVHEQQRIMQNQIQVQGIHQQHNHQAPHHRSDAVSKLGKLEEQFAEMEQRTYQPEHGVAGNYSGYLAMFWDRRSSVGKLIILSLAILFAVSLHHTACFYLKVASDRVKMSRNFKWWQDVIIRIAYPLIILIILWHAKMVVKTG